MNAWINPPSDGWKTDSSIPIADEPGEVYIHAQSFFNIDVSDHSRSVTLESTLLPAFASIDPPHGHRLLRLSTVLGTYIGYLFIYTLRTHPRVLPDGQLEPEHASVCASLRPENRPLFEEFIRRTQPDPGGDRQRLARREFLKAQGRPINRPLPHPIGYKPRQDVHRIAGRPISAGLSIAPSEFSTTASLRRFTTLARRMMIY